MEPDLLRAFVAVVEHRSFTRAASALNRTQSAMSMQVKRLEDRLQVQLLLRTKASVEPTPAGESLLGYARKILSLNNEVIGRLREDGLHGTVRLGIMDDYGAALIPPLLASFVAGYPRIRVEMETGLTATMPERLGQAFDLVVAMHPEGRGEGQLLRREQAIWAAAPEHAFDDNDVLPIALYPPGCLFRKWAIEALDAAGRPWRLAYVSHSLAVVEAIVARGLAVTVVKAGTLPATLRRVSDHHRLPRLPSANIRLHRAADLSPSGVLLAEHLAAGLSQGITQDMRGLTTPRLLRGQVDRRSAAKPGG